MARHYYCTVCMYRKETQAMRGPVPVKCPECKAIPTPKDQQKTISVRKPNRASIEALEKVQRALELRRDYWTWDAIAKEVGYTRPEVALTAARQEMARRAETLNETIDDFRERSLERLESMAAAALRVLGTKHLVINAGTIIADPATGEYLEDDGPKLQAIDRLVKINESARRLVGADAASKTEAQVNVNYTVEGIATEEMP